MAAVGCASIFKHLVDSNPEPFAAQNREREWDLSRHDRTDNATTDFSSSFVGTSMMLRAVIERRRNCLNCMVLLGLDVSQVGKDRASTDCSAEDPGDGVTRVAILVTQFARMSGPAVYLRNTVKRRQDASAYGNATAQKIWW